MSEFESNCEQLEKFLADELDDGQSELFVRHLERCPDCSRQVRVAESLDPMIREAWQAIEMPGRIRQFVATDVEPRRKILSVDFPSTVYVAAAIVAFVLIGISAITIALSDRTPAPAPSIGESSVRAWRRM